MKLAIILLLFTGLLSADDADHTAGMTNGRSWKQFSRTTKDAYVSGLNNGNVLTMMMYANFDPKQLRSEFALMPAGLTIGEVVDSLDLFFQEPTNAPIPVGFALTYVRRKAEGASEADLKELGATLRREISKLQK